MPDKNTTDKSMTTGQIAIVGAGQMGRGIAQVTLAAGLHCALIDHDSDTVEAAVSDVRDGLARLAERERPDLSVGLKMNRLQSGTDLSLVKDSWLVMETIDESEDEKRDLYQALAPHLDDKTILASNSSSISITRLATSSGRPDRFCGLHFMNPAQVIPLVELVRGLATSEETYIACQQFIEKIGKTATVAEDFPGFIVNRVLVPMINEAVTALYEGVGTVASIDTALKLGASHPMGPLELADFIGLDVVLSILHVLQHDLADNKYRPSPLLIKYVEAGWTGKQAGRGFYDYESDPPRPTR